ncbi:hypothetical protein Cgig2_033925 [Carnegiea gigantea]|uniref:Endonuclease/exonuclease/phosphatase domain-containing protein n=1 Tax=Carnegiea gigantea TaxID=171969 RepID=A0A9Q1JS92_9CARY|nr:hypothetical protein Cgig2_033925 [Carnegiea gigantea]
MQVTQRGIYFFDSKPFMVKPGNENMEMNMEAIQSMPLWVQFPELDIRYWGNDSFSKLGGIIGIPIKTDKYTKNKEYLHYARMLIEVPMEGPFPDTIDFINDYRVLVKQRINFEWKPIKCNQCQLIGHEGKEVVKRQRPDPSEGNQDAGHNPNPIHNPQNERQDGFIEVSSRAAARRPTASRVRKENELEVAQRLSGGWQWHTNASRDEKGRLWVAWRPNNYSMEVLTSTHQLIHCKVRTLMDQKMMYITYVYGDNSKTMRRQLWEDIEAISIHMSTPWGVMGDFNSVLHPNERLGGNAIEEGDIRDFAKCLLRSELHELKSTGAFFSWNNKKVWSRLDRMLVNDLWYELNDFSHLERVNESLLDHTPLVLTFPYSPR